LDEVQIQGNLIVSENYYSFLLLFAFCILIFILLYKFSSSPSFSSSSSSSGIFQQGGELGGININYIILGFIILAVFIYYYWFIYNYTAGLISSTSSFVYNTFRI
jgi:preprotein translocase subunit SecG